MNVSIPLFKRRCCVHNWFLPDYLNSVLSSPNNLFTVAVDDVDPVISNCPNDVILSVAQGVTTVTASWVPPTAVDNSGSFSTVSSYVPGNVFDLGSTAVTYTFTDPSGNFAVCAFNVIVNRK